jgi:hypothetical protein
MKTINSEREQPVTFGTLDFPRYEPDRRESDVQLAFRMGEPVAPVRGTGIR